MTKAEIERFESLCGDASCGWHDSLAEQLSGDALEKAGKPIGEFETSVDKAIAILKQYVEREG